MILYDLVAWVVAANDGKVVGKTRLQKTFFLLDQCGMNSGCSYDYHYYGPYSREVAAAAEDAETLELIDYSENPGFHLVPYGVYKLHGEIKLPATVGGLALADLKKKLSVMKDYSAIELELAATIVYLRMCGCSDPIKEVTLLKPLKASPGRLRRAETLLKDLRLQSA